MTKITDTIYWTYSDCVLVSILTWLYDPQAVWRTDRNGDVVIIGCEPNYPIMQGRRMTIADMDECPGCVRCDSLGVPLEPARRRIHHDQDR